MWVLAVVALVVSWSLTALLLALLVRAHRDLKRVLAEKERLRQLHQDYIAGPAVLSHELRTPLTVVRGAAELLADGSAGPMNEMQLKFAKTIAENSNQVIEMAEDMLAEIRMESDLFNLRLKRVEMRELVRHNVINNAARHAGDGVSILVSVQDSDEDVTIAVVDDGRGMTPEEKERLFIPFDTGGSLRPGTGLGMMLTQKILRLHGGTILVDTIASKGTTFYLTIPRSQRSATVPKEGQ